MIVIREIFDGAHELFENELERAFEFGCPTIVIEPCRLGEETARWIWFGEYLTRYSIITGIGSIITGLLWPNRIFIQSTLIGTALLAHGIHLVSWQQDICSQYRVESNPEQYLKLLASQQSQEQTKFPEIDAVSLVTSTQEFSPGNDSDSGSSDDKKKQQQQQQSPQSSDPSSSSSVKQNRYRPTNPYEMILSTSARRQRSPVVLCRRTNIDLRRSNWINAAVSLLAIAFSFIRLVRSSIFHHHHHNNIVNHSTKSLLMNQNFHHQSWSSFLKTLI